MKVKPCNCCLTSVELYKKAHTILGAVNTAPTAAHPKLFHPSIVSDECSSSLPNCPKTILDECSLSARDNISLLSVLNETHSFAGQLVCRFADGSTGLVICFFQPPFHISLGGTWCLKWRPAEATHVFLVRCRGKEAFRPRPPLWTIMIQKPQFTSFLETKRQR